MKPIAHIRASVRHTKLGYGATLHVTELESRKSYRIKTQIMRCTPKDAICDVMQEAQELATTNDMAFKATHANAGDVYKVKP